MRTSKTILRWWLIGYLTGDSTLKPWGLRTSTANPAIAARLEKLLGKPWIRKPYESNKRPLYVFRADDPEIVIMVQRIRSGRFPRASRQQIRAWLAGYLDADGAIRPLETMMGGYFCTIDWTLARLIIRLLERLEIKTSVSILAKRGRELRKNPIFRIYGRPLDSLPSVKIQSYNSRHN